MANFNPNSDATELWLDGADAATLSYHAGTEKVSEWRDKSGHDRHCGQADANRAPRRFGAGIAFDGFQSLIATDLSLPYQNQDFTLGILVSGSSTTGASYELFFSAAVQPQDFGTFALVRYPKSDRQRIDGCLGSDLANYIYGEIGTYSSKGEPHQTIVLTKKAGEVSIRIGGATYVAQPAVSSNDLITQYMIGNSGFSSADYLYGACFEVVLAYNADPIEVEGYLSRKWGTAYALPADHPYHISSGDFLPPSTQAAKVSGIVQIDGTPAQRTVRAFGYAPTVHEIDGNTISQSKSLGHATSDPDTGEYTINLLGGYDRQVFVVAFDDYGADFQPDLALAVGDRVHPTTPNGYVWECVGAGTLPSEEPAWIIDTETAQLYGTASMITRPFYRPMVHGPVMPEVVGINKNDLLAALDAAGTLDSGAYTPETWAILDDAVQAGQAVYDDPEADQATVDAATQTINDAIEGLEAPEPLPTVIGEASGGGFYAGDIEDDGQWYKLIVADIEADVSGLPWGGYGTDLQAATSTTNGPANTEAMRGTATYEAGNHCLDYRGGGFDDWYMPARSELAAIYENLGHSKAPPAGFESGGAQAFNASYYWCSTQGSSGNAWVRRLSDGDEHAGVNKSSTVPRVRPVRRIPFTPEAG